MILQTLLLSLLAASPALAGSAPKTVTATAATDDWKPLSVTTTSPLKFSGDEWNFSGDEWNLVVPFQNQGRTRTQGQSLKYRVVVKVGSATLTDQTLEVVPPLTEAGQQYTTSLKLQPKGKALDDEAVVTVMYSSLPQGATFVRGQEVSVTTTLPISAGSSR